ncbi:MAG TPA: hypothetical protein P5572_13650 [Phycisphaerae bacterium]|nr:hypothetical protein [Phycisphaerales bacterium]HRX86059.1 hypothetical protein [Phycisphaerae bacterium]
MLRRRRDNWRSRHTVLVTDAETLAGIGVIRALGRAGYRMVAAADRAGALGLRSNYANAAHVRPATTHPDFLPWLRRTLEAHAVDVIVPGHAVLVALRPVWDEFNSRLPFSRERDIVDCGLSKYALFSALRRSGPPATDHLPPLRLLGATDPAPTSGELAGLGFPVFAKADAIHGDATAPDRTVPLATPDDVVGQLDEFRRRYAHMTLQGYAPGCGVGAFFLVHEGRVLAEFMHRRLHEVPYTGGVSSLRESWRHEGIRADALAKLRALEWQGVAMLEYRWDAATDAFALVEMNGRFWGSLHLALHAGVDFPTSLIDAHLGRPPEARADWPLRVRCRHTFPRELQHVWSMWKDRGVSLRRKAQTAAACVALCFDPRMHADLSFPGDRHLFWINLARQVRGAANRLRYGRTQAPAPKPELLGPTAQNLA